VSIVSWNLKEAGGKFPNRGTQIALGISIRMSLPNKTKSNNYPDDGGVDVAVTWDERE
jgi:hypothetical protein